MAKKTSVKITGIGAARDNALKFINNTTKDSQFLKEIGQEAVIQIAAATRSGGRTDPAYVQPTLKDSSVERRKTLIKQGNSFNSRIVSPKRSNLSMSGQLLDSMISKVNSAIGQIIISINKQRKPYKGKSGQDLENKDNLEIKNDLEKRGFRFFFLSDKINLLLENKIAQQLRRKLSLYNKITRKLK